VPRRTGTGEAGFALIELLIIAVLALTVSAIAAPAFTSFRESQRARNAARMVERELQTARLKAVTVSRALRVRFDCPAAGQLRVLELTGVAATDNAANRCDPSAFPFPGPNDALRATPSLDSPVIYLPDSTTVAGAIRQFEFDPRGQVFSVSPSGAVSALTADAVLTVTRNGWTNTITINELGRIRLN
jgi:Tfp pilus assembly protein FimT